MAEVGPRDMLNNFCFHVQAQKSLFIAENCNGIFWDLLTLITLTCEFRNHRAGSQLKKLHYFSFYLFSILKHFSGERQPRPSHLFKALESFIQSLTSLLKLSAQQNPTPKNLIPIKPYFENLIAINPYFDRRSQGRTF